MTNPAEVHELKASLQNDLQTLQNQAMQIQGAIAACDKLISEDEAEQAEVKAAKKKAK